MNCFDIAIIGSGVAGSFAAYKIAKEFPKVKVAIIDIGRPPLKRRRQIEGWLGCLPTSDGKFYLDEKEKLEKFIDSKHIEDNYLYFTKILSGVQEIETFKTKKILKSFEKKITGLGYSVNYSDHMQTYSKVVHQLSKTMNGFLEDLQNVTYVFDTEIKSIEKDNNIFNIFSEDISLKAKKVLFCPGRSGWRFANNIFNFFKIVENNDYSYFGVRAEIEENFLKDFNKSTVTLQKEDITYGKFSWNGTTIQEDHLDIAIANFRSNEDRWHSKNVSFDIIKKYYCKERGVEESERLSKLAFLLGNDRVLKEKADLFMNDKAKISPIKEFDWLKNSFKELEEIIPNFINKAMIYYPAILTYPSKIKVSNRLETEVKNMYVAGEMLQEQGLLFAVLSGLSAVDFMMEK
ncbi:MAG: hypothetical protein LC122_13380 [Chitinophagales bacterium]|nr:hypothetical protein [Chitinophagales bacterium]